MMPAYEHESDEEKITAQMIIQRLKTIKNNNEQVQLLTVLEIVTWYSVLVKEQTFVYNSVCHVNTKITHGSINRFHAVDQR